jgi:hypothetical protein
MKKAMIASAAMLGVLAAPAQAACWDERETEAALVRDLQTTLMVAALRCRVVGQDMLADYNAFVTTSRATLASMNDRLKQRFNRAHGAAEGQRQYDRFTTSLANAHGASKADCGEMASLAREARMQRGSTEGLRLLAEREGLDPALAGGICPMVVASADRR